MSKRHIQHALVALERRHGFALSLEVVQAEAHRQFDLLVGSQLGFVGAAARIGIAVVSQRTDGRQRNLLAVVIDQQGRIQLIAQLGEGFAAGELHLQDRLFQRFRKLMLASSAASRRAKARAFNSSSASMIASRFSREAR